MSFRFFNWLRRRYVGMGFVLGYYGPKKAVNGVFVLSRLLDSPAHKAGVQKWDQVLEYAGQPMDFKAPDELTKFIRATNAKLKPGDTLLCKVKRGDDIFELVLKAEVIRGSIPVHLPQARPSPHDADYNDYHYGLACDLRTGEWVPTMRLSDERLNRLLGV